MENNDSAKEDKMVTVSTNKGMISCTLPEKGRTTLTENTVSDNEKDKGPKEMG